MLIRDTEWIGVSLTGDFELITFEKVQKELLGGIGRSVLQLDEVKNDPHKHHNNQQDQDPVDLTQQDEARVTSGFIFRFKEVG